MLSTPFRTQKPTPDREPITRQAAADYLRAEGYGESEGRVIDGAIAAARAACELATDLQLMPAPYAWLLGGWWGTEGLRIPKRPFRRVTKISYFPENGSVVDLAEGTQYAAEQIGEGVGVVHLLPAFLAALPALRAYGFPVRVEFEAGFAPVETPEKTAIEQAAFIPDDLIGAMLVRIASQFDERKDGADEKTRLSETIFANHRWPSVH